MFTGAVRGTLLGVCVGALVASLLLAALVASARPPDSWLWIYVRAGCGPSEQAVLDLADSPDAVAVAVLPLDVATQDLACGVTVPRLVRLRPWLRLVPRSQRCALLRGHAETRYASLGLARRPAPVYQWGDHVSVGWDPSRRAPVPDAAGGE